MNRAAKALSGALVYVFLATMALPRWSASIAEGDEPNLHATIPTLATQSEAVVLSPVEKESLIRLISAANPSGFLQNFDFGDDIDGAMFRAGLMAHYEDWMFGEEEDNEWTDDWEEIWVDDGMEQSDEADDDAPPPENLIEPPYYLDWSVENATLQAKVSEIFGREMTAPEMHGRYYDGSFYYNHADIESMGFGGYDYAIGQVYDLSNGYYKIVGEATLYSYVTGDLESSRSYEAIVKKDSQARYAYSLIAQHFGGEDAAGEDYLNVREEE